MLIRAGGKKSQERVAGKPGGARRANLQNFNSPHAGETQGSCPRPKNARAKVAEGGRVEEGEATRDRKDTRGLKADRNTMERPGRRRRVVMTTKFR